MRTSRTKRHLQNELEIHARMNHKRFGWIDLEGKVVLGMLPPGAVEGDVVCLLRGEGIRLCCGRWSGGGMSGSGSVM